MKFIKKIELINFQSHKHSILELDPHLNVIVGPSDSGKSSIIRAIKWVLYNEPSGDFFIREGESEASVSILLNDSSKITRYRSKSKNSYIINYSNGEELVLNGFGVNVPQEVKDITGVDKVPFDQGINQIVNIADQLEGPFLLSEKNSTKAFVIGGLAGVEIVDDAVSDLMKELRQLSIENSSLEENIKDIDEQLDNFKHLDKLKLVYESLDSIHKEVKSKEDRLRKLKKLSLKTMELKKEKDILEVSLSKLSNLDLLNKIYRDLYTCLGIYTRYNKLSSDMNLVNREKELMTKTLYSLKDLSNINTIKDSLESNLSLYKEFSKKNIAYSELASNKSNLKKYLIEDDILINIEKNILEIEKLNKLLDSLNLKLKDLNNIKSRLEIGKNYIEKFKFDSEIKSIESKLNIEIEKYNKLKKMKANFLKVREEKESINKKMQDLNSTFDSKLSEYQNILLESQVCPTCFSKIDEDTIDNIVKQFS